LKTLTLRFYDFTILAYVGFSIFRKVQLSPR
jgi:hypothetical protein